MDPVIAWRPTVAEAPGEAPRSRGLRGTVRFRTTALATVVVAFALIASSVAMVLLLRRNLATGVRAAAERSADVTQGHLATGDFEAAVAVTNLEEEFVQIIDGDGDVLVSSINLEDEPIADGLEPGDERWVDLPFEDDPFLAIARRATTDDGSVTVVTGKTLETVIESSSTVIRLLIVGIPMLIMMLAAVIWRVVGRALRPVEAIRSEVESMSTARLHRRVPVPPGGDEVGRLAETMNRMLARLEEGDARRRRFVSDASHELRSPLASIRQHSEIAMAHPDTTSVGELAEVVLAEDARLEQLVTELLLLAKADEGTLSNARMAVDLDDLVLAEAERLRRRGGIEVDIGAVSAGRVSGDATQLESLLSNLGNNAARHARGRVAFGLHTEGSQVVLTVDDDGPGIPPDERARVFERFVRLDEARGRAHGGAGLGLAIVAAIAAAHEATVACTEAPLGGARFELRFPAGG